MSAARLKLPEYRDPDENSECWRMSTAWPCSCGQGGERCRAYGRGTLAA
jgi:hypothetical protein